MKYNGNTTDEEVMNKWMDEIGYARFMRNVRKELAKSWRDLIEAGLESWGKGNAYAYANYVKENVIEQMMAMADRWEEALGDGEHDLNDLRYWVSKGFKEELNSAVDYWQEQADNEE